MRERYELPEDYLMWVGGLRHPDPRKRVAALAQASATLDARARRRRRAVGDASCATCVLTGAVDDDDLAAIYSGARALVFPSDDEGFGLPTVEALACGTPVVACDVPALREVLGDRATFVDCDDLEGCWRPARPPSAPPPRRPRGRGRTRRARRGPSTRPPRADRASPSTAVEWLTSSEGHG